MNTTTRISTAERLGRWLGRGWRGVVRGERRVLVWLVDKGVPVAVAVVLVWVVKLAALGVLLYIAFWFAVLILCVVISIWAASQNHSDTGFEFTFPATIDELRETPGYDPNFYGDTSHEMYSDD